MTVKEIMDKLKQFDENLEVELYIDDDAWDIKRIQLEKDDKGNNIVVIY